MILQTPRLLLREMTVDDRDALLAVLGDSEIMCHYPSPFDERRVSEWVGTNIDRYRTLGFGLWAVCLRDTEEVIGDCGLTMQNIHGVIRPEIGYHIRRDMQQKGFAHEAATSVRDWTFGHTPFRQAFSYMQKSNLPSIATAKSIGMRFVEEYVDDKGTPTCVYGISREACELFLKSAAAHPSRIQSPI